MARKKKKHAEHVNHERWLVSYADFITLLFAFFVVMFAVSAVDSNRVGRFTESFSRAVGVDIFPQPGRGVLPGTAEAMPPEEEPDSKSSPMPDELGSLRAALVEAKGGNAGLAGVAVIAGRGHLVLRLPESVLFDSGDATLKEPAAAVVGRLGSEIAKRRVDVRVEGHTDNRPIHNSRYPSNWQLSTARATEVVLRLAAEGLAPERLSAAGYGEFHPIGSNDTDEGRRQNRRVDLVISVTPPPEEAATGEADPTPAEGPR